MLYFENLPIVDYGSDRIRDIFKNVVITNYPADDWYNIYQMNENQTIYDVSLELYGSVNYWWLLAIINNIKDVHFDTFLNSEILQNLAKDTQVIEFANGQPDYLIFPQNTSISCLSSGVTISGEVIKKYIENSKYLLDIRLDNPEFPFPSTFIGTLSSTRLEDVIVDIELQENMIYRQDFIDSNNYKCQFARGYCVNSNYLGGKIFKISDEPFRVTGTTFSATDGNVLTASTLLAMDYSTESLTFTISSSSVVPTFSFIAPKEYENLYLDRFDALEEINNTKRIIKTFKSQYKDLIITQFLNKIK